MIQIYLFKISITKQERNSNNLNIYKLYFKIKTALFVQKLNIT